MLSISVVIFIWFKVRKIIWSQVSLQKNLLVEVFLFHVKGDLIHQSS
jgi:hypothetical protein